MGLNWAVRYGECVARNSGNSLPFSFNSTRWNEDDTFIETRELKTTRIVLQALVGPCALVASGVLPFRSYAYVFVSPAPLVTVATSPLPRVPTSTLVDSQARVRHGGTSTRMPTLSDSSRNHIDDDCDTYQQNCHYRNP